MLLSHEGHSPQLGRDVFIAEGARVIGKVKLGDEASVWFNAVLRGDVDRIEIGARTNIQDGTVVHLDHGKPCVIGPDCTIGHMAVLHGCTLEDHVLIGIGAVVLNNAHIGSGTIIAAGALIPEGKKIPSGVLVMGVPGKVVRDLTPEEIAHLDKSARNYVGYARSYRTSEIVKEAGS